MAVHASDSSEDNAVKVLNRIMAAIGTVATLVVAFWLYWRNREAYNNKVPSPDPLATPIALEEYEREVAEKAKELASADAEEVMKKWKERFGGKQG